jgi:hypothetical protein
VSLTAIDSVTDPRSSRRRSPHLELGLERLESSGRRMIALKYLLLTDLISTEMYSTPSIAGRRVAEAGHAADHGVRSSPVRTRRAD